MPLVRKPRWNSNVPIQKQLDARLCMYPCEPQQVLLLCQALLKRLITSATSPPTSVPIRLAVCQHKHTTDRCLRD